MKNILFILLSITILSCSSKTSSNEKNQNAENGYNTTEVDAKTESMKMKDKIEKKLIDAVNQFESNNNAFLFTIFYSDTAIIQVVHASYIEALKKSNKSFGLALNVTFDPTFPQEIKNHAKFKELPISKDFTAYNWDGIPCYTLDLKTNTTRGAEIIDEILKGVYGINETNNIEIELLDQGKIF